MITQTEKLPFAQLARIECDGCPGSAGQLHVQAGVATYRDGTSAYIALCFVCRQIVRANEADNIRSFRPNPA